MNFLRLEYERREMRRIRGLRRFELFEDTDYPWDSWQRYFWIGDTFMGHELKAYYPENYPYQEIEIKVFPDLETHHKYFRDQLCLMKPYQWSPDYTAASTILIAVRFLVEYYEGELD